MCHDGVAEIGQGADDRTVPALADIPHEGRVEDRQDDVRMSAAQSGTHGVAHVSEFETAAVTRRFVSSLIVWDSLPLST